MPCSNTDTALCGVWGFLYHFLLHRLLHHTKDDVPQTELLHAFDKRFNISQRSADKAEEICLFVVVKGFRVGEATVRGVEIFIRLLECD